MTFAVSGMSCGCCAKTITEELTRLPGVHQVSVDLPGGHITVTAAAALADGAVSAAVERAGYRFLHVVEA